MHTITKQVGRMGAGVSIDGDSDPRAEGYQTALPIGAAAG
jgi:hypothetical protein